MSRSEDRDETEAARIRDAALKRALNTPHKPHTQPKKNPGRGTDGAGKIFKPKVRGK
jgi:hypothetical protein